MSFTPIDWRPEQLRAFVQDGPAIEVKALMVLAGDITGSNHVTVNRGITVAIELLGLSRVHEFMRRDRNVVLAWISLIEDFGWGDDPSNVQRNLQMSLLVNAIKIILRKECTGNRLQVQEFAMELMRLLALGPDAELIVIHHLFLKENYAVPWTIWV